VKRKLLSYAALLCAFFTSSARAEWTILASTGENEYEYVDMESLVKNGKLAQLETMSVSPSGKSFITWQVDCSSEKVRRTRIVIEDPATKTKGIVMANPSDWTQASKNSLNGLIVKVSCK
jgi:hypothetical protein